MRDGDAFWHAGRAGGVDEIGAVIRRNTESPQINGTVVGRISQLSLMPHQGVDFTAGLVLECRRGKQPLGLTVGKTNTDAFDGHISIKRQPGSACLGDGQLGDQQISSSRVPQPDHIAASHALARQPLGKRVRAPIKLAVGQGLEFADQRGLVGMNCHRGREDFRQQFIAQQIGAFRAAQGCVLANLRIA